MFVLLGGVARFGHIAGTERFEGLVAVTSSADAPQQQRHYGVRQLIGGTWQRISAVGPGLASPKDHGSVGGRSKPPDEVPVLDVVG